MRRAVAVALSFALTGFILAGVAGPSSADSVGPPNPLQWKEKTQTSCSSKYKSSVKRGITLSSSVSKKRARKSWGKTTTSMAGNLRTTRYYQNYPLKADLVKYCSKGKVVKSYLPTKYKRFHRSQNFKRGGVSAWIPTYSVRSPRSGFKACYVGYLHPDTLKTRKSCNGSD